MKCRRIAIEELPQLLGLYRYLHPEDPIADPDDPKVRAHWRGVWAQEHLRYYVATEDETIVATCTLALIPNLTRGLRAYGVIENVVTDPGYRKRGFGSAVLRFALSEAWRAGCYKVMLATGSKEEATLQFYENVGFWRGVKTGLVAYPV